MTPREFWDHTWGVIWCDTHGLPCCDCEPESNPVTHIIWDPEPSCRTEDSCQTWRPVYEYPHEQFLKNTIAGTNRERKARLDCKGHEACLKEHYLRGGKHPDDCNLPLNKWDETE